MMGPLERCPDIDADGARCGDVVGHEGRHSWHPSVEQLWRRIWLLEEDVV